MNRIYVCSNEAAAIDSNVVDLLRAHFGQESIYGIDQDTVTCQRGDVLLVLLRKRMSGETPGQTSILDHESALARWIERALDLNVAVIPVLVDGAEMPDPRNLPEELRGFAYQQWEILNAGEQWARDLGKIIGQIEIHLPTRPGTVAAVDYWLYPLGIFLAVWGSLVTVQWLAEVFVWHYGFQKSADVSLLRWKFSQFGFLPLAVGMALIVAGRYWQRLRFNVSGRAENFRHGRFHEPGAPESFAYLTFALGVITIAVGMWSLFAGGLCALAASIAAVIWLVAGARNGRFADRKPCVWGISLAWLLLLVSLFVEWRLVAIDACLSHLSAGTALTTTEIADFPRAVREFEAAKEAFPASPLPYHALANLYYRWAYEAGLVRSVPNTGFLLFPDSNSEPTGMYNVVRASAQMGARSFSPRLQLESIANELTDAVDRYPKTARGLFEPSSEDAEKAYLMRAAVRDELGLPNEAAQDKKAADAVDSGFDILGGAFRWWDADP